MKKYVLVLVQVILLTVSGKLISQSGNNWLTPGGIFDTVSDFYGKKYLLKDVRIDSPVPFKLTNASLNTINSLAYGYTCSAGYFDVYFQNGIVVNAISTPSFITQVQTMVCAVLVSISDFITTYSLNASGAPRINIYVNCAPQSGIADASSVYAFPANPLNPQQGFIDNLVQKMLLTSSDPYTNLPTAFNYYNNLTAAGFFHGYITFNSNYFGTPYNVDLNTVAASNETDLFSVLVHEVGHCLGITTLISGNGTSILPGSNSSYTRYETHLYDHSGNPLLGMAPGGVCAADLSFVASPTSIATGTSGCVTDITTCSTAVQYSGTAVTLTVYTPNCFEPSSSLGHFEDMCGAPSNPSPGSCTPTPLSPGFNNLYYNMANVDLPGICGFKRFFREEERMVLCDLGYSVNPTFSCSTGIIRSTLQNTVAYSSTCTPDIIVGQNDGLANGIYIYTTTTNSFSIPTSSLLLNDLSNSTLSVSCVEMVYTNTVTQFAASLSGNSLVVLGVPGSGLAIVKYTPVNSSGVFGNATYVMIYFAPGNCNPINYCNMIQNGGFENSGGSQCGVIGGFPLTTSQLNCWEEYPQGIATPSLYVRTCTLGTTFNLGSNTLGTGTAVVNSFNNTPNNQLVALTYTYGGGANALKNNLSSPIVPVSQYNLSFWAINYTGSISGANTNSSGYPLVVTIACHTVFPFISPGAFPAGLQTIAQFTIPAGTSWKKYSATIATPSTQINLSALIIGINGPQTDLVGSWGAGARAFLYLDELLLIPNAYPVFSLGTPTICGNASYPDLSIYSGTADFSGTAVTLNNSIYSFNLSSYLPPGNYPIQALFTAGTCTYSSSALVTVVTNTDFASLADKNLCSNTPTLDINNILYKTSAVTGGTYYVNGSASGNTISLTSPGTVTIGFAPGGTGLCSYNTVTSTVISYTVPSTPSIFNGTASINTTDLCIGNSFSVSATSSGTVFSWQPPGSSSYSQTFSPTITTIYTLTAFNHSACVSSQTLAINVFTNCCNSVIIPPFTATSISGYNYLPGPFLVSSDFTVQSGGTLAMFGTYLFNPNIKITVDNGGEIDLSGARLAACTNTMWQGIIVKDGGLFQSYNFFSGDNLIEDAITAIDASSQTSSTLTPSILNVTQTTFNKNYVDIIISDYSRTVTPYPFFINNCVFTCRDLSSFISPTAWPQTTLSAGGLRYASTPTTGLAPPYIDPTTIPFTNLKSPYSAQPSHIAIQINSVGITTGSLAVANGTASMIGITIGDNSSASNFNLFDAHGIFISAQKSNVTLANNVFQNTQTYTISGGSTFGGSAVKHAAGGMMHTMLYMDAPNISTGNRFWNCHRGIELNNTYLLWLENSLFRSTQSSPSSTVFLPGNIGIYAPTNNFDYYIANNEFTNLKTAINIPVSTGGIFISMPFSSPVLVNGIFAKRIRIDNNVFAAGTGTTTYMERAIDMTCPNATSWQSSILAVADESISPETEAFAITNNTITEAFNGISINGSHGFPVDIASNVVSLKDNSTAQYGIALNNCVPTSSFSISKNTIAGNTASFSASSATANTQSALIFCGNNGYGISSPSVSCNTVKQGYTGFAFELTNAEAIWGANEMQLPMQRGMVLQNSGIIGVQGGSLTAMNYQWTGGTWNGTSEYHTYTQASSASLSVLWVRNIAGLVPSNSAGLPYNLSYATTGNYTIIAPIGSGDFTCDETHIAKTISIPREEIYNSTEEYYMAKTAFYRFLHFNDSILSGGGDVVGFYDDLAGSSIDKFLQVEEYLYQGNIASATDILGAIDDSGFNTIESNYKTFYTLYLAYLNLDVDETYSPDNRTSLHTLASLCPAGNGNCIYQAIALYNTIYGEIIVPDCSDDDARKAYNPGKSNSQDLNGLWKVNFYPNPANNELTILTNNKEKEELIISICDLSGRQVCHGNVKIKDFIAKLDLDLINGAYFISISNSKNEKLTKKLLISK